MSGAIAFEREYPVLEDRTSLETWRMSSMDPYTSFLPLARVISRHTIILSAAFSTACLCGEEDEKPVMRFALSY